MFGKSVIYQHVFLGEVNFDIQHSMNYNKGGFISIRYNDLRDLAGTMMSQVCKDTKIEPKPTPLSGEELQGRTSNNSNKARKEIRTQDFWERGQQALLALRVFDGNAYRYCNKTLQQYHVMNEQKKETSLQGKNPSNRPWYIYTSGVLNQR